LKPARISRKKREYLKDKINDLATHNKYKKNKITI
jgi:hypothetical protein